jgi:phenylalanyl-tRNA synthetase alpha chain
MISVEGKSLSDLEALIEEHKKRVLNEESLEDFRREWLAKEGYVKQLFNQLRLVEPTEKPAVAQRLNLLRQDAESFVLSRSSEFVKKAQSAKLAKEYIDCSIPGVSPGVGAPHPITRVERKIFDILKPFGFTAVEGPELETEYYCFDSLNIPQHHPARDMQDTFYAETGHVLRTHTTSVQARTLKQGGLPIKIASFGRTFRNETEDASHQAMFHQFELVWLEEGLTMSHLMGLISHILKNLYGTRRKVRFVPKFYPYTEPSLGPQLDCSLCKGKGCAACGGAGWVTVGGAGMIHRKVLREFGYDPEKVSGIAFGLGSSRLVGQFFGVPTLKMIYENDLRVLRELV